MVSLDGHTNNNKGNGRDVTTYKNQKNTIELQQVKVKLRYNRNSLLIFTVSRCFQENYYVLFFVSFP